MLSGNASENLDGVRFVFMLMYLVGERTHWCFGMKSNSPWRECRGNSPGCGLDWRTLVMVSD